MLSSIFHQSKYSLWGIGGTVDTLVLGMKALISTHSLLHILLQQQRFFLILTHYAPVHQFRNYAQHIFRNSALVHTIVSKCSPPEFSEYMSVHQSWRLMRIPISYIAIYNQLKNKWKNYFYTSFWVWCGAMLG